MRASTLRSGTARTALPLLLLCALTACGDRATPVAPAATEAASLKRGTAQADARRLVNGLEGAFGITVGPGGALFVAEWAAGRIARIDPQTGAVTTFASGLPANLLVGGGVFDLAFIGSTAYALVSIVNPEVGGSDVDGIYRIDGPNSFTIVADIGAFNKANPPETDFFVPTGVPFALELFRGGFLVTDGHLNRVLYVTRDGKISVFRAFDNIVPTGLDVSGQAVYMAEAGPLPHLPEDGKVVVFGPTSTTVTEVASGARLAVDVEFGRGRTLFALSQGVWDGVEAGEPALPNTGALMRVNGDGSLTTIIDRLNQPISLEIINNTAYVVTLGGEIWAIDDIAGPPFGQPAASSPTANGNPGGASR
jgi:sugar lactone lactonase YvrE